MNRHLVPSHTTKSQFSVCRYIEVALLLCLSAVLSVGAVSTGAQPLGGGSASGTHQVAVTLSLTSLTFGSQTTGTKSAAQTITLTNVGAAAVGNILISTSSNFTQTNNWRRV